jgi:class 3 adenylate cyclase
MIAILGMTGLYFRNINKEKRRSDDLLLNILPAKTAEELKEHGKVKAKKFDSVTVMFTDFQAFTKYSQSLSPEVLVESVDYFFSKFDQIIDTYKLEKIKTIGDAYMCAGGLTNDSKDHIVNVIRAAFEIKDFVEETKQMSNDDITHFNIRIGINTGTVVAGVVGKKKFAYDIWGDTVNVASRMESNSEAGKINISENTYQLIKDHFDCEYRGEIDVKNKGMMKMYFVIQPKNKGQIPVNGQNLKVLC